MMYIRGIACDIPYTIKHLREKTSYGFLQTANDSASTFSHISNTVCAEYCHISPNTTIGLSVHTNFTLTNNTKTYTDP